MKIQRKKNWGGPGGLGQGVGLGGQARCKRRIEVFVKIQINKFGGGGGGSGGGGGRGCQGGCERRIEFFFIFFFILFFFIQFTGLRPIYVMFFKFLPISF